ncbi:MAG: DinB family protein, partial [Candidatus Acidiferrales bacterium]
TEELKKALAHLRGAAEKLNETDMTKEVQFRRRQAAMREVLLAIAVHLHEHLGQSIAYARSNKVVPPWSAGN